MLLLVPSILQFQLPKAEVGEEGGGWKAAVAAALPAT